MILLIQSYYIEKIYARSTGFGIFKYRTSFGQRAISTGFALGVILKSLKRITTGRHPDVNLLVVDHASLAQASAEADDVTV